MVFSEDREKAYTLIGSKRKFSNFWLSGRLEKNLKHIYHGIKRIYGGQKLMR